jgi:hypothetical protein
MAQKGYRENVMKGRPKRAQHLLTPLSTHRLTHLHRNTQNFLPTDILALVHHVCDVGRPAPSQRLSPPAAAPSHPTLFLPMCGPHARVHEY